MGLWVPVEFCVTAIFLRKPFPWAKMNKKMVKNAPKVEFFNYFEKFLSLVFAKNIFKEKLIWMIFFMYKSHFCWNSFSGVIAEKAPNQWYCRILWSGLWYISGWNSLISLFFCMWTDSQKRTTSNPIFSIRYGWVDPSIKWSKIVAKWFFSIILKNLSLCFAKNIFKQKLIWMSLFLYKPHFSEKKFSRIFLGQILNQSYCRILWSDISLDEIHWFHWFFVCGQMTRKVRHWVQ